MTTVMQAKETLSETHDLVLMAFQKLSEQKIDVKEDPKLFAGFMTALALVHNAQDFVEDVLDYVKDKEIE